MRLKIHQTLICLCCFILTGCYRESDYEIGNRQPDLLFDLSLKDTINADGKTRTDILITGLPVDIEANKDSILVSTSRGSFDNGSSRAVTRSQLSYDTIGKKYIRSAKLPLISPQDSGRAIVTVTIQGISKIRSVQFKYVYPESARILTNNVYLTSSYTTLVPFYVTLTSPTGFPSIGNGVRFFVEDNMAQPVGTVITLNNRSDSSGRCAFNYVLADSTYKGNQLTAIARYFNGLDSTDTSLPLFIF